MLNDSQAQTSNVSQLQQHSASCLLHLNLYKTTPNTQQFYTQYCTIHSFYQQISFCQAIIYQQMIRQQSNKSITKSVSQKLFEEAKWKKAISHTNLKIQQKMDKHMADSKKTSENSQAILLNKHFKMIDATLIQQPYNSKIDIGKSINLFFDIGVFGKLKSVDQLAGINTTQICDRMQTEIKFIYLLWQSIPFQELPSQCFKNILRWLFSIRYDSSRIEMPNYLRKSSYKQLYSAWNKLSLDIRLSHEKLGSKSVSKQKFVSESKSPEKNVIHRKSLKRIYQDWMSMSIQEQQNSFENKQNYPSVGKVVNPNQLVSRLYDPKCYQDRQNLRIRKQQQKLQQQLQKCTFKPNINKAIPPQNQNKINERKVKGYFKTIDRLRQANQKYLQNKKIKQHVPRGQNYEKQRKKAFNPPKFLNRKKNQQGAIILSLQLEICKKRINVNLRDGQNIIDVVFDICRIYSFNQEIGEQIRDIIQEELSKCQERLKTIE